MNDEKMEVVKSVRITLTMDDIVENLSLLSKEQILQKFRLLLDRKEIEINEKIQKNNAEHLLVLQKKMVILERKDDQIFKLNNALSTYKNELNEEKTKNNDLTDEALQNKMKALHFEKKYNEFDSILKEQKAKREKLKKEHDKLQVDYKILLDEHHKQTRTHKKIKEERVNWQEQTEMLLNNLKKTHEKQLEEKIKMMKLQSENKLSELSEGLHQSQVRHEAYKEKYSEAKAVISNLNRAIEILNKELVNQKTKHKKTAKQFESFETQTDASLLQSAYMLGNLFRKQFLAQILTKDRKAQSRAEANKKQRSIEEKQIQVVLESQCLACKELKSLNQTLEIQIKNLKPKQQKSNSKLKIFPVSVGTQTDPPPIKTFSDSQCQTIFLPLSNKQEEQLFDSFQTIKETSGGLLRSLTRKYDELEALFLGRPSKLEDREKIHELERKLVLQEMSSINKAKQVQGLEVLISELQHKINQQTALLSQFNINEVQIRSNQVSIDVGSHLSIKNKSYRKISRNETKDNVSISISVRDSIRNNRSLSPRVLKSRNLSGSESFLNSKIQQEAKQVSKEEGNLQQFKSMLISRGINFKLKAKEDWKEQISEVRQYKKFKGSLKKVRL